MTEAAQLRALLKGQEMIVAPGAYDGLTAKLVEQAGFAVVYMTGAGTAAAAGYPDFGLLTMTEMVANAAPPRPRRRHPRDRRRRHRLRQRAERVPHGAGIRTRAASPASISRTRSPPSAAAIWTARRSCRARTGSPRSAPPAPRAATRFPDHRAHRRPRGGRVRGSDRRAPMRRWRPAPTSRSSKRRRRWRRSRRCRAWCADRAC